MKNNLNLKKKKLYEWSLILIKSIMDIWKKSFFGKNEKLIKTCEIINKLLNIEIQKNFSMFYLIYCVDISSFST